MQDMFVTIANHNQQLYCRLVRLVCLQTDTDEAEYFITAYCT